MGIRFTAIPARFILRNQMETDLNNMTMRDLFAAFAMAGMLASDSRRESVYLLTRDAYKCADAMIETRSDDAS